ncbi:glycosyltransferase [Agrobacterium sp. YIC 4121]|uniref:glycosyltransferase n=1 Tax=Agrobacterium sp. YIC 4121 TaxID=1923829 RepID=UPI00098F04C8|nr:glycosyltransferase [Agrobacterium sp. YIC 4121]
MRMDDRFEASVIVPTYNRAQLLDWTLQSLERQVTRHAFEVIVVDDGSSDDTRAIVARHTGALCLQYHFQEDIGFRLAEARNTGIIAANGDICIFTDAGVLPSSRFVDEHVNCHNEDLRSDVAVVGYTYGFRGQMEDYADFEHLVDPDDVTATILRLETVRSGHDIRDEKFYAIYGEDLAIQPAPWVAFWGCNISAKRSALMKVGMFDPNYRAWGFEDLDLGYRLFVAGNRFCFRRAATAVHYPQEKDNEQSDRSDVENKKYFHRKFRNRESSLISMTPYNLRLNGMMLAGMYPQVFNETFLEAAGW